MDKAGDITFFLGGYDLEMVTIRDLLMALRPTMVRDKRLAWGAKASHYKSEIAEALQCGQTPALVELEDDMGLGDKVFPLDHHGPMAGADKPSALRQVFELIKAPKENWSRYYDLVSANDIGYIPGLFQMGATIGEVVKIRLDDRQAQGVTEAEDSSAKESAANAAWYKNKRLVVARLPHSRTSPLTDALHIAAIASGAPAPENILVLCPDQTNYFGLGAIVYALNDRYPGGWYGGALPVSGFWGINKGLDITDYILEIME